MTSTAGAAVRTAATDPRADYAAFEHLTRALMGITAQSLEALGGSVTVSQFRLLRTLDALGPVSCTVLAGALGTPASSVTRLADKLAAAGLVARERHPRRRNTVTIEATEAGRGIVAAVIERRRELFEAVLDAMAPDERVQAAAAARRFARLALDSPPHRCHDM